MMNRTRMNADLQDLKKIKKFCCFEKQKEMAGMSFNLRQSETICVLKKEIGRR
jgi:hypothetical protein